MDGGPVHRQHLITVGVGELTRIVEYESAGSGEELFLAALNDKEAVFVVNCEIGFDSGGLDWPVFENGFRGLNFRPATDVGQRAGIGRDFAVLNCFVVTCLNDRQAGLESRRVDVS